MASSHRTSTIQKILFAGTTCATTTTTSSSSFSALFERAKRAHEKAGPFEALFILGDVVWKSSFSSEEEEEEEEMSKKKQTRESVNAFVDSLRKDEITMKTFTMDLFLLERLKELEGEEKTGVRLVDAEEFDLSLIHI